MGKKIIDLLRDGYEVNFYWISGNLHIALGRGGYMISHVMSLKDFFDTTLYIDIEDGFTLILEKLENELAKKGQCEDEKAKVDTHINATGDNDGDTDTGTDNK